MVVGPADLGGVDAAFAFAAGAADEDGTDLARTVGVMGLSTGSSALAGSEEPLWPSDLGHGT